MRAIAATLVVAIGGLTLTAFDTPGEPPRSPEAQAKLDKWLGGRVAGERRTCLPVRKTNNPIGIDDRTVLFRDGPHIWLNEVKRSFNCGELDKMSTVYSASDVNRLCNGDKLVFDSKDGAAACELGDFVRYEKP